MRSRIVGTGHCVPEKILTNADLETMVDTTDEWITVRTGIKERRVAEEHEALSDFAVPAAERALEMAGIDGSDIDMVLVATVTPDRSFPATSTTIQHRIGAKGATAFDLSAACTGFLYGVEVGDRFIRGGAARNVLVVGGDVLTKITDFTDRATCVLFGDGAGAVVLTAESEVESDNGAGPRRGILATRTHADGSLGDLIERPGGGSRRPSSRETVDSGEIFLAMRGNETFRVAVRSMAQVSNEVLADADIAPEQVDWFIPHQANRRIIDAVGQRLDIQNGHTVVNVERFGNTSAASIPIALDEVNREGKIAEGDVVLMTAFGSGLTWGAAVARW